MNRTENNMKSDVPQKRTYKVDEIAAVNKALEASEVVLETMDGSHDALTSPDFISRFLMSAAEDEDNN